MNIRTLRMKLKLTQIDLAKKCGVSLTTLRNWESGVTTPSEDNMKKLNKALKVCDENEQD
jgi:transcriptional regulator with XRE-family HTH domain